MIKLSFGGYLEHKGGAELGNEGIPSTFTKRKLVSFVNGIYDPMGLVTPIITKGKIAVRKTCVHEPKLGWDDSLPESLTQSCVEFIKDMTQVPDMVFDRCVRPDEAVGDPSLITFSDASKEVFGACCYLRCIQLPEYCQSDS